MATPRRGTTPCRGGGYHHLHVAEDLLDLLAAPLAILIDVAVAQPVVVVRG